MNNLKENKEDSVAEQYDFKQSLKKLLKAANVLDKNKA